jgi:hypothetical protein
MEKSKKHAALVILFVFLFSTVYAVLRYNIAGGVLWSRFPMFVLNKSISLTGFILLIISYSYSDRKNTIFGKELLKHVGISGFLLILLHAVLSLLLFRPSVYPKFFDQNEWLTTAAGISVLTGVIAAVLMWIYNMSFTILYKEKITTQLKQNIINSAMLLSGFHLFFMGYKGWFTPEKWFGKLPPISLIAFIFFVIGMGINFFNGKK